MMGVLEMKKPLNPTWNLESFFPGGSNSLEFAQFLEQLTVEISTFKGNVATSQTPTTLEEAKKWLELIMQMQEISKKMRQAGAFLSCLNAQNVKDQKAKLLSGEIKQISASFGSALTQLDDQILNMSEELWNQVLQMEENKPIAFPLNERRIKAKDKMSPQLEALANELAVDGYHAWGDFYNTIVGRMTIPFEKDSTIQQLSVGQAQNMLNSEDRLVRESLFKSYEESWKSVADLNSTILNHMAGFRINLYKNRGWDSILKEPLEYNRMSEETLNAMWSTIEKNKGIYVTYLERKAKILGLNKLSWFDVDAPIGNSTNKVSYDEAADFIVEHFRKFSPRMADFTVRNFEERWIEAEDRPGKRPGGFCTSFPLSKESRIFMTFNGTASNVSTLAHELGHAYHQHVMNDLPQMAQGYAMNVAETASTFAELIVSDAAVKAAKEPNERLALLEDKVNRGVAFFMNIHSRFIFETGFYAERKKGLVSIERLNELMVDAQKKAYLNSLDVYHPYFWESKLHFFITGVPFYNFPYTFGYLFSSGVYARALAEGPAFEQKYVDLLRDTGSMKVEDLAMKHLGVDLTKPEFWQSAIDLSIADVKEFLSLTE